MRLDPEMLMRERENLRIRAVRAGPHRFTNDYGVCWVRGDSVTAVYQQQDGQRSVTCIVSGGPVLGVHEPIGEVLEALGWA